MSRPRLFIIRAVGLFLLFTLGNFASQANNTKPAKPGSRAVVLPSRPQPPPVDPNKRVVASDATQVNDDEGEGSDPGIIVMEVPSSD